jgi:tRNA 2-thiocytidine biosynthesis protein TtcA
MITSAASKSRLEFNKLSKRLRRNVGQAIEDFNMIEDGDRVMVCLSGGKDSYTLLDILLRLRDKAPVDFEIIAVNLDQKQPDFPEEILPSYLREMGIPFHILEQDTYSVIKRVVPEGKTLCGLCSRLRRGSLYTFAKQQGMTKIALGHHRDDIIETFFLNLFFGGRLKTMPPKLLSDDGAHVVIRPLAYCRERDIETYSEARRFPIIPCNLCGSQDNLARQRVKRLIDDLATENPKIPSSMLHALGKILPSQMMDRDLWDFKNLEQQRVGSGSQTDETKAQQGFVIERQQIG